MYLEKTWQSSHETCDQLNVYQHHHVEQLAQISLTLSCHSSLSSIAPSRSSRLHPVSAQSYCREVVHFCSSFNLCSSIRRGPQKNISYEFALNPLAVSRMFASSNLDGFRDGWWVAVQLLFYGILPPGLVQ